MDQGEEFEIQILEILLIKIQLKTFSCISSEVNETVKDLCDVIEIGKCKIKSISVFQL